jgi:pantoate--beta-alanine ligase
MTEQIDSPRALFERTDALRRKGERIGFVPTMGALHDGHLSLIDALRAAGATRIVVSIFVNPLQFGPNEDLAKYPRTLAADLAGCAARGVDIAYTPTPAAMYPSGFQTHVEVEQISLEHEGPLRPGHFRGVATVVTKLFNAAGPCIAAFGRKDYQQLQVITRMVRDLDLPVEILPCPTLREPDGLAMSSRNRYLSPEQRTRATAIYRGMQAASAAFARGERDTRALLALAEAQIAATFDSCDYITVAQAHTLASAPARADDSSVMLVAARLGSTRLIDNCLLGRECLDSRHTPAP